MRTFKTLFVASLLLGVLPIACPAFGAVNEADKLAGGSISPSCPTTVNRTGSPAGASTGRCCTAACQVA